MNENLKLLFNPKTVGVIGASSNLSKWGNWIAEQVVRHKNIRKVYFVSSKSEEIFDVHSLTSIGEISEPLDVAIVAVPLNVFELTVDSLLLQGTKVIVAITTGFSERDNVGFELERRIVEKVHRAGSLLIGPNCAGIWDSYSPFHCLPIAEFNQGPVGLISQSGGVITDVALRLEDVGLGLSKIVSTGNQAGVSLPNLIACLDEDPNTKVIGLYIENEKSIPYHVFKRTSKPIVLLTPDTSPASRKAAMHHTNSVPSNNHYNEMATVSNRAYHTRTISEFVSTLQLVLFGHKDIGQRRTAIVTDSGGLGIFAAAAVESSKLSIAQLSPTLKETLHKELKLPQAVIENPIDMINTKGGFTEPTIAAMKVLQASEEVDAIIFVLFLIENAVNDMFADRQCGYRLATLAQEGNKPVVFVCKNLETGGTKELLSFNIPVYRDVETAVSMLEKLCGC